MQIVREISTRFICQNSICKCDDINCQTPNWHIINRSHGKRAIWTLDTIRTRGLSSYLKNNIKGALEWACDEHKPDLEYHLTGQLPSYVLDAPILDNVKRNESIKAGQTFIMKGSGSLAMVMEVQDDKINVNINGHQSGFIPINEFINNIIQ